MKKIVSLLLAVVLLATMFCVFAVPASAAEDEGTLTLTEDMTLSGTHTYSRIDATGTKIGGGIPTFDPSTGKYILPPDEYKPCHLTIARDAKITVGSSGFSVANGCSVTIERGAEITLKGPLSVGKGSSITIGSGASIISKNSIDLKGDGSMTVEGGATVTLESSAICHDESVLNVEPGALVMLGQNPVIDGKATFNCGGILKGMYDFNPLSNVNFMPGVTLDIESSTDYYADNLVAKLKSDYPDESAMLKINCEKNADGINHITAHVHSCPGGDTCCGEAYLWGSTDTGSVLSEGSLTIICSVACLAVGFLVAMFIFKKKKPATAGGENTDEE